MWIARDEDNELWSYLEKPKKYSNFWDSSANMYELKPELFPDVQWGAEPKFIRLIREEWRMI